MTEMKDTQNHWPFTTDTRSFIELLGLAPIEEKKGYTNTHTHTHTNIIEWRTRWQNASHKPRDHLPIDEMNQRASSQDPTVSGIVPDSDVITTRASRRVCCVCTHLSITKFHFQMKTRNNGQRRPMLSVEGDTSSNANGGTRKRPRLTASGQIENNVRVCDNN
jgi:hypothetical protein